MPTKMSKARWIHIGMPLLILFTVSMIDKSNINILLANKPFLQDLGISDGDRDCQYRSRRAVAFWHYD